MKNRIRGKMTLHDHLGRVFETIKIQFLITAYEENRKKYDIDLHSAHLNWAENEIDGNTGNRLRNFKTLSPLSA